jgi:hypothetical protein
VVALALSKGPGRGVVGAIIKVKVGRLVCLYSRIMNFGDMARA